MKINDLRREREVENLKVVTHTLSEDGEEKTVKCVEYDVIGKNNTWPDYMYYDDFKEQNPEVTI